MQGRIRHFLPEAERRGVKALQSKVRPEREKRKAVSRSKCARSQRRAGFSPCPWAIGVVLWSPPV
jgi:hypothetical protein